MTEPPRVRLTGPLSTHRDGLWAELSSRGYTPVSSANLLRLMAHLSRWLEAERLDAQSLDSARIEQFLRHRREAGYTCWLSPRGLEPVLVHLRSVGAVPPSELSVAEPSALELLLREYHDYLVRERALASSTRRSYLRVAREFMFESLGTELLGLDCLSPADVTSFIVAQSRSWSVGLAKCKVTALRSLLRYLHVRGDTRDLAGAVPAVAGRRLVGLPKALTAQETQKLLRSCDRRTRVGRRDFVVLLLMLRLGLRAGEVVGLRLEDLDWMRGELMIQGKGGREDRLPLTEEVGEAIVSYLTRGRQSSEFRQLVLRSRAPFEKLNARTINTIVVKAGRSIGMDAVNSHRLRHTAATRMLNSGVSLSQIGQVLRHQHLDTTAIYAKVDRSRLRTLGRLWPGGPR